MFDPETPVLTHVFVMIPWVQPVVRPILFATSPATSPPLPLMVSVPAIVTEPSFGPVVAAMPPNANGTPLA